MRQLLDRVHDAWNADPALRFAILAVTLVLLIWILILRRYLATFMRPIDIGPKTEYDAKIVEYLEMWRTAGSEEEHLARAKERFGLDEEEVAHVNQVLCSGALGTLRNYTADSRNDPWWIAAARLASSPFPRRRRLRWLRRELQPFFRQ